MIISHSRKFVLFRVPKTGSTTAMIMARLSGGWDHKQDILTSTPEWKMPTINLPISDPPRMEHRHGTPESAEWRHGTPETVVQEGLLTEDQLHEYNCMAFVRDPFTRFVSGYFHCCINGAFGKAGLNPQQFLDRKNGDPNDPRYEVGSIVGQNQVDWFHYKGEQVVTPLLFDDFANEIRRMIASFGGFVFEEIPLLNVSKSEYVGKPRPQLKTWAEEVLQVPGIRDEIEKEYPEDIIFYNKALAAHQIENFDASTK